ncbi:MAG: class I SAM-dependent methyltransferase [Verrucomicrobia bacterium]|nr:class I SAM-dependent methyltransferase [Verrucomicrobiota bacterium]
MLERFIYSCLGMIVRFKRQIEEVKVRCLYGRDPEFRFFDRKLCREDPYRISRQFLQQRGEAEIHTYGETPLTTLHKIMKAAYILPNDHLYDLGCGPGRTSLWMRIFVGCTVTGVERILKFVEKGSQFQLPGLHYLNSDLLDVDYSEASAIYLYGTGFPEPLLGQLGEKLKVLEPGSCIITVSYPWSDYSNDERLRIQKVIRVPFPWGKADVYIQRVT